MTLALAHMMVAAVKPRIFDDFTATDGFIVPGKTTSDGGKVWSQVIGDSFRVYQNMARPSNGSTPTTAYSGRSFIAVDAGYANAVVSASLGGGGDALYFRILDVNNWWRVRLNAQLISGMRYCTYPSYKYTYVETYGCSNGQIIAPCGSNPVPTCNSCPGYLGTCCSDGSHCANCSGCTSAGTCTLSCGTYSYYSWSMILERCDNGSVSYVSSVNLGTESAGQVPPGSINPVAVRVIGGNLTVTTAGAFIISATDTVAARIAATQFGIGVAGEMGGALFSALDNFLVTPA